MKRYTPYTLSQFAKAQRQSSMPKPNRKLLAKFEDFGRERLSEHFFMRDFLYSEVSAAHGIPNVPDDAELAVRAGKGLCENLLEPLRCIFGHVVIRSAFRSAVVNGYGNKQKIWAAPATRKTTPNTSGTIETARGASAPRPASSSPGSSAPIYTRKSKTGAR